MSCPKCGEEMKCARNGKINKVWFCGKCRMYRIERK